MNCKSFAVTRMKPEGCPVCGYPEICVLDDHGCTTFEICDCYGRESGYKYSSDAAEERLLELCRTWLCGQGGKWHSTATKPPAGWDLVAQLRSARFHVPEKWR